jgi:callose synthase
MFWFHVWFFAAKFGRDRSIESYQELQSGSEMAQDIADIKFTYVVSCQVYGMQKTSKDEKDKSCYLNILNLMITYRS